MAMLQAIEKRRAYRAIGPQEIDTQILERLVEAAHTAPSSANNQPWRMVTVTEKQQLDALKQTLSKGNYWALEAPAIVAFVTSAEWSMSVGGRDLAFFELGMAAMALSIASCRRRIACPSHRRVQCGPGKTGVGNPMNGSYSKYSWWWDIRGDIGKLNEKHHQVELSERNRKPLDQISSWDKWDGKLVP